MKKILYISSSLLLIIFYVNGICLSYYFEQKIKTQTPINSSIEEVLNYCKIKRYNCENYKEYIQDDSNLTVISTIVFSYPNFIFSNLGITVSWHFINGKLYNIEGVKVIDSL